MSFDRNLQNIYSSLPVPLQNLACTYYGWREKKVRMGKAFNKYYEFLLSTDYASKEEIKAYQDEQVCKLITHVYQHVPYYQRIMDERGLKPKDITSRNDLKKLPILTKEDIIKNYESLQSTITPESRISIGKTSGTTGTALKFLKPQDATAFQWALWWRHRKRFDVNPGEWHVNFSVRPVVPVEQKGPPFWRWDYMRKQLIINMQSLKPNNIKAIARIVDQEKFIFYSGAPSMIHVFVTLLEEHNISLKNNPRVVFIGAENLLDYQKTKITQVLKTEITDQYGFSEACGNASKCKHEYYHEDWEFGILDFDNETINPDDSYTGNIIATGFANYYFPFIRYQVGDVGTWMPEDFQCSCGRQSKAIGYIDGRVEDYIITPEGNKIMRFGYVFKETRGVKEAQIIQKEKTSIIIRIVPRETFSEADKAIILDKIKTWVSPTLKVYFEIVNCLPRTTSGKLRAVVSELTNK